MRELAEPLPADGSFYASLIRTKPPTLVLSAHADSTMSNGLCVIDGTEFYSLRRVWESIETILIVF
jgi:hypothetical protein